MFSHNFSWARVPTLALAALVLGRAHPTLGQPSAHAQLARAILEEIIEIRSTAAAQENTVVAAEALAQRLLDAGFPSDDVQVVVGPGPQIGNLVARFRADSGGGDDRKPILLMAHLDVVDALRSDWSFDPYEFREEDGYFYGRGTSDNKAGAAIIIANFVRLKEEGFAPGRDLVAVLTGDEETDQASIAWLVRERRELIDAAFAINSDSGGGATVNGKPHRFTVQASEKIYLTFELEVSNPGGHSSIPRPDNAIYRLMGALSRLSEHTFPVHLNEVTRTFFERSAELEDGSTAADMRAASADPPDAAAAARLGRLSSFYNAMLRTTCVATRLEAGHADNALPQTARATLNCRILPNESPDDIETKLVEVIHDDEISITRVNEPVLSPPSPLDPAVMAPIAEIVEAMWPGVPIIPRMSTGATDGLYVRNGGIPVYGVSAIFDDPDDVRAHGRDERVPVKSFYDANEFWYRMLKALSR